MTKMTLIALIIASFLALDNCIDQKVVLLMRTKVETIGLRYPITYQSKISITKGNSEVRQGEIKKREIHLIGSRFNLPYEISSKFAALKFAKELKIEIIHAVVRINDAHFHQYIGSAYVEKGIVKWSTICGRAQGNILPQYTQVPYKKCQGILWQRKCWTAYNAVPRGLFLNEKEIVKQALRARGFQEIMYALNRNEENSVPLDLSNEALIAEKIKNNEPIFIDDATLEHYGLLGKGEGPYSIDFTHKNELVMFDRNFKPVWDSANYFEGVKMMLKESYRYYSYGDNEKFLLLTPDGRLGVYTEHVTEEGNYQQIWESENETEDESEKTPQGPFTFIIEEGTGKVMVVDANNEVYWQEENAEVIPLNFK